MGKSQNNSNFELNIPYYITLISLSAPLLASSTNLFSINNNISIIERALAEAILLLLYAFLLMKDKRVLRINYKQLFFFGLLLLIYIYNLINGNIFGVYGLYSIFLMVFIYTNIFRRYGNILTPRKLYRQINFIIMINIIFIIFENVIAIAGLKEFLLNVTNNRYRIDLYAPLSKLIDIDFTAANSLLLKAQATSVILAISVIWYLDPFEIIKQQHIHRYYYRWAFLLASGLFLIQFSTTSMIALFLMLIFSLYLHPPKKTYFKLSKGVILIIVVLLSPLIYSIIFFKIKASVYGNVYIQVLLESLNTLSKLDTEVLFFGIGGLTGNTHNIFKLYELKNGDVGIIMVLIMGGLYIYLLTLIALIRYFYIIINTIKTEWSGINNHIASMCATLSIIVFGLTVSIIHYTNILQPGGRHMYSFIISVSIYYLFILKTKKSIQVPLK